jgi:hypothetical protein
MLTSNYNICKCEYNIVHAQWEISPRAGPIEHEPAVVGITRFELLETISEANSVQNPQEWA